MKKRISMLLAAVAMVATGLASTGCIVWLMEEPASVGVFKD